MNLSQKQYLNILGFVFAYLFVCVCICIFVHVFEFVFGAVLLLWGLALMSALINSLVREEEVLTWSSLLTSYMQYHLHVLQYHVHLLQYHVQCTCIAIPCMVHAHWALLSAHIPADATKSILSLFNVATLIDAYTCSMILQLAVWTRT